MVDQQALAYRQQISPGFALAVQWLAVLAGQHPNEGILTQISGIPRIAQTAAQPVFQPTAMLTVEILQGRR